ncbi:MAG: hypothetical protein BAA02_10060 [Paenibacillaceae bacterium ZCTH02-B3]|nr:MAG: hypothetical protein BAA02_10060 [Paenibacillaceae bacterium ZCTH02-B3]
MPEYMKTMRRYIGTRPLLLCGASVMIFDDRYRVLMLKRADNRGRCFPGGLMEPGESAEETAGREVLGETGLAVKIPELLWGCS